MVEGAARVQADLEEGEAGVVEALLEPMGIVVLQDVDSRVATGVVETLVVMRTGVGESYARGGQEGEKEGEAETTGKGGHGGG